MALESSPEEKTIIAMGPERDGGLVVEVFEPGLAGTMLALYHSNGRSGG